MKILKSIFLSTLLVLPVVSSAAVIGGFDSRTLSGIYSIYDSGAANSELTDASNYALYGDSITFAASTTTATDTYLGGIDIFFTGLLRDANALTTAEVSSLTTFINNGGVVIAHGDNTGFDTSTDALLNVFGLDITNSSNNTTLTTVNIDNSSHPVMNGPFGAVGSHSIRDSARLEVATGVGENIASYSDGFGAIGVVNPGVGRLGGLLFLPDSESYGLRDTDFRGLSDAETLFNNSISWAIGLENSATVPEPSLITLLGLGLVGIGFSRKNKTV